jgi:hypothetical protein
MKSKTLMTLAVAGSFACGGAAFAGPFHFPHGAQQTSMQGSAEEVMTPSSVDESAPWLANEAHSAGWIDHGSGSAVIGMQEGLFSDGPVGSSSSLGGSGSGGFDSMSLSDSGAGYDASVYGLDYSLNEPSGADYWLWGSESDSGYGTGMSSSAGAGGSGGFDSTASFSSDIGNQASNDLVDYSLGTTDYYMITGPLSQFDPSTATLREAGPDDIALLTSPPEDVWIIMPSYDSVAAVSSFDSGSNYSLSQYDTFSADEDSAG